MTRLALCVLLLVTAAALTAPAAFATDYCVANSSCGGTNVSTLEAALDAADNAPDPDRIFLGAATYTAPTPSGFAYIPGLAAPVEIIGHGVGETVLTSPIGGFNSVLRILGSGSSIHDLTVRLPQYAAAGSTGIETIDTLVKRVAVVEAASQLNQRVGIWLHGGVVEDSTVDMSVNQETTAVGATHGGEDIRRSTLKAQAGVAS